MQKAKKMFQAKIYSMQDGTYQVAYRHPVTQKRHRIKFNKLKEANVARQELEMQFHRGNKAYFVDQTVGALVETHLKECPQSRFFEIKRVQTEFMSHFKDTKLKSVDRHNVGKWLRDLQAKYNYSESSMNKVKACMNWFFKYLIDKEILRESPLTGISFRRNSPVRKRVILSEEELRTYMQQAKNYSPDMLYPFLYALVHTGARMGEMVKLEWRHVDFQTGFISLHNTKNGEDRSIKMSVSLFSMLYEMKQKANPTPDMRVFRNYSGEPITRCSVKHHLKQFKLKMRHEKNWTYHSLRHSFAFNFLKKGGQMYQLQAILGHKSIQMTVDLYGSLKAVDVENPSPYEF